MALPKVTAPRHVLTVPSTGEEISYRPYLVKEEKVLMMAMESNNQQQIVRAIVDTIKSCTEDRVDANNITTFDLEYIFLQLRTKSVGEATTVRMKCSECEEMNDVKVDLASIEAPVVNKEKRIVKISDDISIQLKYPMVRDAMNGSTGESVTESVFDAIMFSLDKIFYNEEILEAKDHSKQELMEFIESMNSEQFEKLGQEVGKLPALSKTVQYDCVKCSHHNEKELKGLSNFFS